MILRSGISVANQIWEKSGGKIWMQNFNDYQGMDHKITFIDNSYGEAAPFSAAPSTVIAGSRNPKYRGRRIAENRVWSSDGKKRIGDANRNRPPEIIQAANAKREVKRQAREKARFKNLKEEILPIFPQCGATAYELHKILKTLGWSRRGVTLLLADGVVKKIKRFGPNRRYFLSSVDPEQFRFKWSSSPTHDTHVTKAQAQRISQLRPQPSLKLLEKAVAKAKLLTPEHFATIPDESGLYLLHATGSPRGILYYVGISQNLHARLCPGSNGSNHYDCYTRTPFNRGGNLRLWYHTQKYGIDSLHYTALKIFDKPLTPQEIADIETAWIQILPKGQRANAADTSVGAATVSAEMAHERVKKISHGTVELEADYTHSKVKIPAHCLICDYRWVGTPNTLFSSELCPKCTWKATGEAKRMTHEEFVASCKKANPNNIIIGRLETSKKRVRVKCKTCNHEWSAWPIVLLGWGKRKGVGGSCKECAWNKLKDTKLLPFKEAAQRLHDVFGGVQTLITYGGREDSKFFCNIHQREWEAGFHNVLGGVGCPECVNEHISDQRRLPDDEVIRRAHPSLEVLEIREDTILVRCRDCGHPEWETERRNVMMGSGCPYCSGRKTDFTEADKLEMLRLHEGEQLSVWKIADRFKCNGQTVLNYLQKFPNYTPLAKRYDHEEVLKQLLTIFPKEGLRKGEIQRRMLKRFDVKLNVCEVICILALKRNLNFKESGKMGNYRKCVALSSTA
jgi:Zn finger protein HypA/HybF involved in hydrogenase expression